MKRIGQVLLVVLLFFVANMFLSYSDTVPATNFLNGDQVVKELADNEIIVYFLPIEQGEATLIQLPNESFYLIDTGSTAFSEDLIRMLYEHGVTRLKGLFLTNSSKEHTGGLSVLLNNYPVEYIYIPQITSTTYHIPRSTSSKVIPLKADEQLLLGDQLQLTVLFPSEPLSLSPQVNSLVMHLVHQQVEFLFTGDINEDVEQRLIEKYALRSKILKVSDFGSNEGSSSEFLQEVDPQVGIIFSSDPNLYRVDEETLERLNETWVDVYQIKNHGEIQIISDGNDYQVESVQQN